MAILFTDGFDSYGVTTGTNLLTRWPVSALQNNFSSSITPYGYGQSYYNNSSTSYSQVTFTASSSFTVGMAVYLNTLNNATVISYPLIEMFSGATSMILMSIFNDGNIQVWRGGAGSVLVSSSGANLKAQTWYYIELSVFISDTLGTVSVNVDGKNIINQSNLDTRNGTPTTVDTFRPQSNNNCTPYIDDLYISDSTTPLGPQRIYTLRPNADTVQKQWSPLSGVNNYAMVNETITDGNTSYVQASTVGDFDLYDIADYPTATATIKAVTQLVWARKTDATVRTMNLTTKSGTTTTDSTAVTLATSFSGYNKIYETDPNTGVAWTVSGVNALQIGQKVAS